ncbi:MAG: hypothetical protein CBD91_03170 [Phycisphaeraceae bacterium TMED231]|nr:MAG: hypothetical protein CBD91_03170 [Phycisphaeraceae bacterium TMED231]
MGLPRVRPAWLQPGQQPRAIPREARDEHRPLRPLPRRGGGGADQRSEPGLRAGLPALPGGDPGDVPGARRACAVHRLRQSGPPGVATGVRMRYCERARGPSHRPARRSGAAHHVLHGPPGHAARPLVRRLLRSGAGAAAQPAARLRRPYAAQNEGGRARVSDRRA